MSSLELRLSKLSAKTCDLIYDVLLMQVFTQESVILCNDCHLTTKDFWCCQKRPRDYEIKLRCIVFVSVNNLMIIQQ